MQNHHRPSAVVAALAVASAVALSAAFAAPTAHAATIAGSFTSTADEDFDLTALGTTDWAYWDGDPAVDTIPTNRKFGGTAIGDMDVIGSGAVRGSTSSTLPQFDFTFTDGTAPTAGSVDDPSGRFSTVLNTTGQGVTFDVTLPTADPYTVSVWAAAFGVNEGTFTASLPGATNFVNTDLSSGQFSPKSGALYTLTVTPDNPGDVLTVSLVLTEDGGSSSSNVSLHAAAVSVVPEPATLGSALLGLGMLAGRRRR